MTQYEPEDGSYPPDTDIPLQLPWVQFADMAPDTFIQKFGQDATAKDYRGNIWHVVRSPMTGGLVWRMR